MRVIRRSGVRFCPDSRHHNTDPTLECMSCTHFSMDDFVKIRFATWSGLGSGIWIQGLDSAVSGFGFRVSDFRIQDSGLGPRVTVLRFRVSGFGFRVSGLVPRVSFLEFWVSDFGIRDSGFGIRDSGRGSRVSGLGFRVSDFVSGLGSRVSGTASTAREFFIANLLVRNHFIIVMIRWTGLAP